MSVINLVISEQAAKASRLYPDGRAAAGVEIFRLVEDEQRNTIFFQERAASGERLFAKIAQKSLHAGAAFKHRALQDFFKMRPHIRLAERGRNPRIHRRSVRLQPSLSIARPVTALALFQNIGEH